MSDSSRPGAEGDDGSPLARLDEWYHVPALVLIIGFMYWVRTRSYDRFTQNGKIFFTGNDPYYHYREVSYTVKNWPATMPFDPWTFYPYGTSADQFGTLFDQLIATAALIVGLGSPSEQLIKETMLLTPAVMGALIAVPMFVIGRRLGGRFGGLFGVVVLALFPGAFLRRSMVGSVDHHVAEALFQAIAVLGIMVALAVAERDKPVYELLVDRDVDALRAPLGWGALAGIAMGLYIWTWPPGLLLFAIAGTFFVVKLSASYLNGHSPEPVAFAGAVSMGVAGAMSLVPLSSLKFSPTSFGLLQSAFAFAVAGGCVFMAWLAREWEARELDRRGYPLAVFGLIAVAVALLAVLLPDVWSTIYRNFQRFLGFSAQAQSRTIGEAQPFLSRAERVPGLSGFELVFREYGAMFFVAIVTAAFVLLRPLLRSDDVQRQGAGLAALTVVGIVWQFDLGGILVDVVGVLQEAVLWEMGIVAAAIGVTMLLGDHDAEEMFVVTWALFITAAAFTQIRFNYYLALAVVALNAYAVGQLMALLGVITEDGSIQTDIEPYQIMALMMALLIVLPGLVVPVTLAGSAPNGVTTDQSWKVGNSSGPSQATQWQGTFDWMQNNTPGEGKFGGADDPMKYYGTYERPEDGNFQYGDGTYGVMSWWDYGHWITVQGKRIPTANPFQQGATTAANFLLAPNESAANARLDRLNEDGERTRYVMVDWKMVQTIGRNAKFSAPTVFYDAENVSTSDFVEPVYQVSQRGGVRQALSLKKDRYYKSLMVRLYKYHGSAANPQPAVIEWRTRQFSDGNVYKVTPRNAPLLRRFDSMANATAYAESRPNAQVGGYGNVPTERIPALQHYRLVKVSESSAIRSGDYVRQIRSQLRALRNAQPGEFVSHPNWVKTFERVPGATIRGTGAPANTSLTVSVRMRMTTTNETFRYTQYVETGPNGTFETTVPYSTTGYENFGPENGYTNVSVRADGPYRVTIDSRTGLKPVNNTTLIRSFGTVNVSESHVLGQNQSTIEFRMNTSTLELGRGNQSTGNQSTGNQSTGNQTDGNASVAGDLTLDVTTGGATTGTGNTPNLPAPTERDPWEPADSSTRAGLLVLLLGGLLVEVRD